MSMKTCLFEISGPFNEDLNTRRPKQRERKKRKRGVENRREGRRKEAGRLGQQAEEGYELHARGKDPLHLLTKKMVPIVPIGDPL